MLKRNIRAITVWDEITDPVESTWVPNLTRVRKYPHPIKLDNGIWDLACSTFPDHNIILSRAEYFEYAYYTYPMSIKGKRGFAHIPHLKGVENPYETTGPAVVLKDVITGAPSILYYSEEAYYRVSIFPEFDQVISFGGISSSFPYNNADEGRQELKQRAGDKLRDLFQTFINSTQQLYDLGLYEKLTEWNYQFFFGSKDDKCYILMNPIDIGFENKYNPNITGAIKGDYEEFFRDEKKSEEPLQIPTPSEDSKYIVNYDVPTWKPKSDEEIHAASSILNTVNSYMASGGWDSTEYLPFRDRIMNLICMGHAERLLNEMETTELGYLAPIMNDFVLNFKQLPYDRKVIDISTKNPNEYQAEYKQRREQGKSLWPIVPPEDRCYFLSDMQLDMDIETRALDKLDMREEYHLEVHNIPFHRVRINGIEFKRDELKVLYNTQLYDLTLYLTTLGSSDITISYVSTADLKLFKDLLAGRLMCQTFRDSLSKQGVTFMGGDRTFFQLTQLNQSLLELNSVFSFGKPFLLQLEEANKNELERWNEFLDIVNI